MNANDGAEAAIPGETTASPEQPVDHEAWARLETERQDRDAARYGIRRLLEAQPSARTVHTAAQRWITHITALADEVAAKYEGAAR
jgi:hypothetical protein